MNSQSIMIMDMMGGGDCYIEGQVDKRTIKKGKKGFRYHWRQDSFNPINHDASFYISFHFKDGSKLKNAFEYHWRFWTIPEVREMLEEAGFSETSIYWDMEDEKEDEDDEDWQCLEEAESAPCWICYIVAKK